MLMLKEMEYVYAVYQEQSFSKAAEKLFISQPALSAAVRKAEAEIHTPIFDRSTNPIRLTAEGEYYINSVRQIMRLRDEMREHFEEAAGERQRGVQVGAASFFCIYELPGIIEEFQRLYPNCRVNLLEANAKDLRKCLQTGVIDLSLDVEPADPGLFQSVRWREETILLAVPSGFAINGQLQDYSLTAHQVCQGAHLDEACPAVNLSRFANETFLLLKRENDLHHRAMRLCKNAGFTPKVGMQLDQMLTSFYVACSGRGAAFLRDGMARLPECESSLLFYKLNDANTKRDIFISHRLPLELSRQAALFMKFLAGDG